MQIGTVLLGEIIGTLFRWSWARKFELFHYDLFNVLSLFQTVCTYWRRIVVMKF